MALVERLAKYMMDYYLTEYGCGTDADDETLLFFEFDGVDEELNTDMQCLAFSLPDGLQASGLAQLLVDLAAKLVLMENKDSKNANIEK